MAFNIDNFSSAVGFTDGIQFASKFHVRVYPPVGDARLLEFFCESTSIPGMNIGSTSVKPLGYGSQFEAPLVPVFEDISIRCMIDNSGQVTTLFAEWQKAAVNFDYAPGEALKNGAFQVSYSADYHGLVEITTFGQDGTANRTISLHNAWPKTVGQVEMSWRDRDQYSVLPVTFTYRSYTTTDLRS